MLKNFPRHGTINFDFQSNNSNFMDLVNDMRKTGKFILYDRIKFYKNDFFYLVKKCTDRGILPLECLYLNKNVFVNSFGQLPSQPKHFTLKRKAKSAALRAELLQKAADVSSGKRSTTGSVVPIRCRGIQSDSSKYWI